MGVTMTKLKVERRLAERALSDCVIKINELSYGENPGEKVTSKAMNMSSNGLLVESDGKFSNESILKLEINLPRWEKYKTGFMKFDQISISKPLVALGKVFREWETEDGKRLFGIKFLNIDKDHQLALDRCIEDMLAAS